MNDVGFPVTGPRGHRCGGSGGLKPIKVNMVVRRGLNEQDVVPMARFFRERGHILRFIEYMDVGHTNGWRLDDVVPADEIVAAIDAEMPLVEVAAGVSGRGGGSLGYRDGTRRGWRDRVSHPTFL